LNHYIQQVLVEQTGQQIGYVPTKEEYTRMRLGTSGITPGLAFCEYTSEVKLPREIMESTEMRVMWKEATSLCMM
jgi:alpha-muurolene/germacrene-A/gamma-muurolene synthase